jgi:putative membrane protein
MTKTHPSPMSSGRSAAETVSDKDFVSKVQSSTQFEIASSKLVLDKSQDKQLKTLAQRMVHDHTKAAEDLSKAIASESASNLPKDTPMSSAMQQKMQQLQAATGKDFDETYVAMMVEDHEDAVKLFKDFEKSTKDTKLQSFAQRILPIIEGHLNSFERIQKSAKSG